MVSATNVIPYPGELPLLPPAKEECNVAAVTLLLSIRFHLCRQACSDNLLRPLSQLPHVVQSHGDHGLMYVPDTASVNMYTSASSLFSTPLAPSTIRFVF